MFPGTLNYQPVTTQFPMSPPPEEELRLQRVTRPPHDFMHKLAAIVPIDTTKPISREKEKDKNPRKRQRSQSRVRSRAASPDPSPRKLVKTHEGDTSFGSSRGRQPRRDSLSQESLDRSLSRDRSGVQEHSTTKVKKSRESKHADETQKADRRKSNPEGKSRPRSHSRSNLKSRASAPGPASSRKSGASQSSRRATLNTPANRYVRPPPFDSLPPVAPPSPSDDPLLLVPSPRHRSRKSLASPSKDHRSPNRRQTVSRYDWTMESSDPLSRNDISLHEEEWDKSILGLRAHTKTAAATEKQKKERKRKSAVEVVPPSRHVEEPVAPLYDEDSQMRDVFYDEVAAVEQGWAEPVEEPSYQEHSADVPSHEYESQVQQYPDEGVQRDYVVPMNFGSSVSQRIESPIGLTSPPAVTTGTSNGSPDLLLFASPTKRKGIPPPVKASSTRSVRPPSPWLRPSVAQEESFAQQEVEEEYWAPLQDNASDSDEEQQVIEDVDQSAPELPPREEEQEPEEQEPVSIQQQTRTTPVLEPIFPRRSVSKEPTRRSVSREPSATLAFRAPSVQPPSKATSLQPTAISRAPSVQPTRAVSREPSLQPEIERTQDVVPLAPAIPTVVLAPATPSPIKPVNRTSRVEQPAQVPSPIQQASPAPSPPRARATSSSPRSRTQTASPVPFTRRFMSPIPPTQSSGPIYITQPSPEQEQSGYESDDHESGGFGGGKTLSQRFADLEVKLAKEGRSFRFSEIAAIPSSDHSIRFGPSDLPDSSPQKASTVDEEEQEEVLQESLIVDEEDTDAMDIVLESAAPERKTPVLQEESASFISPIQRAPSVHEESVQVAQESHIEQVVDASIQDSKAPATVVVPSLGSAFPSPLMARQEMLVDEEVQAEEAPEEMVEAGPSWEDDTDAEPLVQIRSMDPHAAARAAAILNLHHEYVQGTPKRRASSVAWSNASRRHSVTPAVGAQPRSSQVFATPSRIGGEVSQLVSVPQFDDMTSLRGVSMAPSAVSEVQRVPPPWTRQEWKALEQCFTDVRNEAALAAGMDDVDPEDIELDDVVDRFVDNFAQGIRLKGEWSWDKMRRRACALISRQKEGKARGLAPSSPALSMITPVRPSVGVQRAVRMPSEAPTNYSQDMTPSLPRRNRDMPPPAHIPIRTAHIDRSKSPYPSLPPSKPYQIPSATPLGPTVRSATEPTSASRRMLNWMGSFLRSGSQEPKNKQMKNTQNEYVPCLPPISDADREALRHVPTPPPKRKERIVPPKEQVQLQHVPTPQPIRIPRKLNHKSSTGSVKDMIKSFESLSEDASRSSISIRSTIPHKISNISLASSARTAESSTEWSKERSELREMSFGSVRSLGEGRIKSDTSWIRE